MNTEQIASILVALLKATPSTESAKITDATPRRQIVIGERAWVWVGDVTRDGGDYVINNASCIRLWGTENGLGQLAREGKQKGTVLDLCGVVRVPELAVIGRIDVAPGVVL